MKLEQAVSYARVLFGEDIILQERFVNILDDLHAFNEDKPARYIISSAVQSSIVQKLKNAGNKRVERESIINDFVNRFGFQEPLVRDVFFILVPYLNEITVQENIKTTPFRCLDIALIVDTSVSVPSIQQTLTNIVREIPKILFRIYNDGDTQIRINLLSVSDKATWNYADFRPIDKFDSHLVFSGHAIDYNLAFQMLRETIGNVRELAKCYTRYYPAIIIINDGHLPTSCKQEIDNLYKMPWFRYSTRLAVSCEEFVDKEMLRLFTGASESMLPILSLPYLESCFSSLFFEDRDPY